MLLHLDFCLHFERLVQRIEQKDNVHEFPASTFCTASGHWSLAEDVGGDVAWLLCPSENGSTDELCGGCALNDGRWAYPASWENLIIIKNLIQVCFLRFLLLRLSIAHVCRFSTPCCRRPILAPQYFQVQREAWTRDPSESGRASLACTGQQ